MAKGHRMKPNDSIFSMFSYILRYASNLGDLRCDGVGRPNLIVVFQILPNIKYRANDTYYTWSNL